MIPKEKAQELVDKFKEYVHGYVGSSMLTNHEYPEQIVLQAKKAATIVVDEIIGLDNFSIEGREYWKKVFVEIERL